MAFNQGFVASSGFDVRSSAYEIADALTFGEMDVQIPFCDDSQGKVRYLWSTFDLFKSGGGYPSFNPADIAFQILTQLANEVIRDTSFQRFHDPKDDDIFPLTGGDQDFIIPSPLQSWSAGRIDLDNVPANVNHWYNSVAFGKYGWLAATAIDGLAIVPVQWINFNPTSFFFTGIGPQQGVHIYTEPGTTGLLTMNRMLKIPSIYYQIDGAGYQEYIYDLHDGHS